MGTSAKKRLLLLPLAALTALAGCSDDDTSKVGAGGGVWTELDRGQLDSGGGAAVDSGGRGAPGGNIDLRIAGGLSFGVAFDTTVDAPTPPDGAMHVTTIDQDATITGPAVLDGNITVNGDRKVTMTGGDLFVAGTMRAADADGNGRALTLEAPGGTIYVTGTIDTRGAGTGAQAGGALTMTAARIVVTGTITTAGADGDRGGRAGDLRFVADQDVMIGGTIRSRGGAALKGAADTQGGAAAALAIEAGGNVYIGGTVDLRGGFVRAAGDGGATVTGGAGGNIAIGAVTAPASVTFALDVSLAGGDGYVATGGGGNVTAVIGGDFTLAGQVRSHGGSIAPGGSGDGGLAGSFTLDINTIAGNQTYRAGSLIELDGGGSGGAGIAGGGGHLYGRSYDGIVTMSGRLNARGGAARDPGGTGGLGGHVNLFSDANYDGVGGNLTVTPEGVIDASGGAGTVGGSARNDGTYDVASFPDNQELIAVLLNGDGIHGTPLNGIVDNQGAVIVRGGAGNGAGGDVAFHGEGTGGLHDPLPGRIEVDGHGSGAAGQYSME
jgi:hypothetical protein